MPTNNLPAPMGLQGGPDSDVSYAWRVITSIMRGDGTYLNIPPTQLVPPKAIWEASKLVLDYASKVGALPINAQDARATEELNIELTQLPAADPEEPVVIDTGSTDMSDNTPDELKG